MLLSESMARWIDETGGILQEMGVDESTRALMADLHEDAWFKVNPDGDEIIVTTRGGRRG